MLAEHHRGEKIQQAFNYAMAKMKVAAQNATWHRKGTWRSLFWEFAVEKLIELTADDPGLYLLFHHDTVSFIFDDAVLVRLKKATISLHTSNYPTPTAELFHDPEVDLFGFEGLQRVEAVYVPNRFDTDIIWTGITAHDGDAELWHFELVPATVIPTVVLPAPVQPSPADLVRLKNQAKHADRKKNKDRG